MWLVDGMGNGFWRTVFSKLWAIDSTKYPEHQFSSVRELLQHEHISVTAKDLQELVKKLRLKHLVDEISIANFNGSLIVSSTPNGLKHAISSAALFSYISSEVQDSQMVFVKSDAWLMIFPLNKKLFVVKANASLTEIELKALASDVERFLEMGFLDEAVTQTAMPSNLESEVSQKL